MSLEQNTWDSFVIYDNVFLRAWNLIYMVRMRMLRTSQYILHSYSSGYQIFHFEKNKNTTNSKDTVIILTVFGLSDLYVRSKFLSYDLLHDFRFLILFFLYLFFIIWRKVHERMRLTSVILFGNIFLLVFISLNFKWQNEWKNTWETWRWMQIVTFFYL